MSKLKSFIFIKILNIQDQADYWMSINQIITDIKIES